MILAYLGPRDQAAAAALRRLRRRRHDPHAGPRDPAGATGCRSWRTRSTRSTPNGCTATPTSSSRSSRARHQGRDQRPPREDRVPRVRARHHQASAAGRPIGGLRRLEDRPPDRVPEHAVGRQRRRDHSRYYAFQIRVPVDDNHTMHLWYTAYVPPKGPKVAPHLLDKVHVYDVPYQDENGEYIMDNVDGQDMMAWITQGAIADRTLENLGASDNGIALYRRVLRREIKKVEQGVDPMCTSATPRATRASTCRTKGRSITTATAFRASCCVPMRSVFPCICAGSRTCVIPSHWPALQPSGPTMNIEEAKQKLIDSGLILEQQRARRLHPRPRLRAGSRRSLAVLHEAAQLRLRRDHPRQHGGL